MIQAERRPDASMDMLRQLREQPLDPDYTAQNSARDRARRTGWRRLHTGVVVVALLAGGLFAAGAVQTQRARPAQETERRELIARIDEQQHANDDLHRQIAETAGQVETLREAALGDDGDALTRRTRELQAAVAGSALTGPGLVIDLADGDDRNGRLLDTDLQSVVNGLWAAGAEGIAINGYRIGPRSAIRGAGDAITVNYRSLVAPYRIEAVGNRQQLPAAFAESTGGRWAAWLQQNYGVQVGVRTAADLELAAVDVPSLRWAKEKTS